MTQIKKIIDKQGNDIYLRTHTKAVIDDNGYTAESRLQAMQDEINQKQLEVGAVPSDLTPTKGSTNWVTSGGIYKGTPSIIEDTANSDLNICDEYSNRLVEFAGGELRTKNFDSSKTISIIDNSSNADIDISDENGNILVRFADGHIKTKMFDSSRGILYKDAKRETKGSNGGNTSSALNYDYIGIYNTACESDGVVTSIEIKTNESGTTVFALAKWDETHGYIDIDSSFEEQVVAGVNKISINKEIKSGYQLFVIGGIKPLSTDGTNYIIAGNINIGDNIDAIWIKQTSCYLMWEIYYPPITIKNKVNELDTKIETYKYGINNCLDKISTVNNKLELFENGIEYRIVVSNGQLTLQQITINYNNILVIAHSFGCILGGVWDRGMSSSKISTDWVHQIIAPLNVQRLYRVNGIVWEQHQDNPTSYLSEMFGSYLNTNDIDAVFIMLGANIPTRYRTSTIISENYTELINYIKERIDTDIYICSPGYTDESDIFNRTLKTVAQSASCTYIETYSDDAQKYATMGDAIIDASTNNYWFINSSGRVTHPNDRWHLYIANRIITKLGHQEMGKLHKIKVNADSNINYHSYDEWVEGGRCSVIIYNSVAPNISVSTISGNSINGILVNLANESIPSVTPMPKFTYHFDMPNEDIIININ